MKNVPSAFIYTYTYRKTILINTTHKSFVTTVHKTLWMHGLMEIKQVIKIPKAKKKKKYCYWISDVVRVVQYINALNGKIVQFLSPHSPYNSSSSGGCNKPGNLQYSDSVNNQRGTRLNNVTSMSVLPLNLINSMLKRLNNTNINFFY